ncbi:MAG: hypothetical protein DI526_03415 [Caulobacter segnis]|uniref:Uncharacterized protein n=1 Tax=Caulobacter segnis TaxID=88688 RepID=A0A2W5WQT3_9CAUL|nr:MAG: hypothetical protein DI526_03415 [Caulobacter segnis]
MTVVQMRPEHVSVQPVGADLWWVAWVCDQGAALYVTDPSSFDSALTEAYEWELPVFIDRMN